MSCSEALCATMVAVRGRTFLVAGRGAQFHGCAARVHRGGQVMWVSHEREVKLAAACGALQKHRVDYQSHAGNERKCWSRAHGSHW